MLAAIGDQASTSDRDQRFTASMNTIITGLPRAWDRTSRPAPGDVLQQDADHHASKQRATMRPVRKGWLFTAAMCQAVHRVPILETGC